MDGCDGNDPLGNPTNQKYGGTYVNSNGMAYAFTPMNQAPTFPPNGIDTYGNTINPSCVSDNGAWPNPGQIDDAISQYCVDGAPLGTTGDDSNNGQRGLYTVHVHVSSQEMMQWDAEGVYQQGGSVCRHDQDWSGTIRAQDCKDALNAMQGKCKLHPSFRGAQICRKSLIATTR